MANKHIARLLNLVLVVFGVAAGLALLEIGVRVAGVDYNLSPNWKFHPVLGWSQVPNGKYESATGADTLRVQFNSLGFRDKERTEAKPPGVRRVVVIGDSFSEAIQVNLEDTFQARLERLLNESDTTTWEVINLGVGDFGTAQEYIALMRYGLRFDPDVVIHQIFPMNDICNNSLALYDLCLSQNDNYRPYFTDVAGALTETYMQPARTWMRRNSASYNAIEYWLLKFDGYDPHSTEDRRRPGRLRKAGFTGLDPLLLTYVPDSLQPEPVREGWRITERLIERIVAETKERDIRYLGMVVPLEPTIHPNWEKFARALPPPRPDPGYPDRRLDSLFTRLGVPTVMLAREFQPYLDEVLPFIGGHLSVPGHRRAAEALHRAFLRNGIILQRTSRAP